MNTIQPRYDSIIDEIHAIREHFVEQYNNDLVAYSKVAEAHCRALGFHFVEIPYLQSSMVNE
jgi:hypothetical protein